MQREVAKTTVTFTSESGECSPELEKRLQDFTRDIQYLAKKIAEEFGLLFETEES